MHRYILSHAPPRRPSALLLSLAGASLVYSVNVRKSPLLNDGQTWAAGSVVAEVKSDLAPHNSNHVPKSPRSKGTGDQVDHAATQAATATSETLPAKDNDLTAWESFATNFAAARESISSIQWSSFADRMSDLMLPDWVQDLPRQVNKLQTELTMAPGSLADEIWQDAQDTDVNPEIAYEARVRLGKSLCKEELDFRVRRKRHTTTALAKYLGIPEDDIDPDDVPTIAMCGSGGGLRALVAGASSYLSAQEAGLFDCVTYTAGVSGSCWLQTLYFSSICGQRHSRILDHLKNRINVHIAYPPTALDLFTKAPTNKFLLSGCVEKLKGDPTAEFGVVDAYGLLLAARLLVPRGELGVNPLDLKISSQRAYLTKGEHPLPIYTAVRHEIPIPLPKEEVDKMDDSESLKEKARREAWFQWFEFTPYELWCEELDAGIPAFAVGRKFERGKSEIRDSGYGQPEIRIPLLMGIWGSAFCATLAHYYKEIRPIVQGLTGFAGVDGLIDERSDDLVKVHPIVPATIPNYAIGLDEAQLCSTTPKSIFSSERLQLMDAGMSNNLPIYPLLREGRNIDVLIAFDASANIVSENWLSVVDGYAKQRGIKGWPVGAGWPKEDVAANQLKADLDRVESASVQQAAEEIADVREERRKQANVKHQSDADLSYCNVWVGTTMERESENEPSQSKRVDPDANWRLMAPDAGIAVIYFPFLPNPKVEGVDPNTSDFMSTWNFIYSPEEIEKVVSLARANFGEGNERTRRTIMAVYKRKKAKRLAEEEKRRTRRWKDQLRESGDHFV